MTERIHILSDSTCDLTPAMVSGRHIDIIGMEVTYDGQTKTEFYEIDPREYWRDLTRLPDIPKTAQITPLRFLESFEKAMRAGATHLLAFTISSTGSGTYGSCLVARDLFFEAHGRAMEIEIIDSRAYSMIYGRTVLNAAKWRDEGRPFSAIVAAARAECDCAEASLLVYSLSHMRKSGRIGGGAAFVGERLGLKPILLCCDGVIDVVKKARGEKKAAEEAVALVRDRIFPAHSQEFYIMYGDVPPAEVDRIEALLGEFRPASVTRVPFGCCVATNTGPEAVAIVYSGRPRT